MKENFSALLFDYFSKVYILSNYVYFYISKFAYTYSEFLKKSLEFREVRFKIHPNKVTPNK